MTTYKMTTISNDTRIRTQSNTGGSVLALVPANVQVTGTELFTATVPLGNYQRIGDKWLKVTYNGVTGWMAYIHNGAQICKDFQEEGVVTPPPVVTPPAFPEYFDLVAPTGESKRYVLA